MVEHLEAGGRVELAVTTEVESGGRTVDLSVKAVRLMVERDALARLERGQVPIENQ